MITCQYCGREIDKDIIDEDYEEDFYYILESIMACPSCAEGIPGVDPVFYIKEEEDDEMGKSK